MDAGERELLGAVPVGLQLWEAEGELLVLRYANPEADRQAGFAVSARVGEAADDIFGGESAWTPRVHAACVAQEPVTLELPYLDPAMGGETWWRAKVVPLGGRQALATYWNVTAHKRRERELRTSERLNREILAGLQEGVLVIDTEARVLVANEAAAEVFGLPVQEIAGRALSAVAVELLDHDGRLIEHDELPLAKALRGVASKGEVVRFVRRDGSRLWVEVHANPLVDDDGELHGAVATYDDVTARVEEERRTRHEADHDALTGLANRRALERMLEAALARAATHSRTVGVLLMDLNGFKAINDRHGHAAGDEVLRELGRRLRRSVRQRDLVARLGGDEFVVVLGDLPGPSAIQDSVERIRAALEAPVDVPGSIAGLAAAMGVAMYPGDAGDVDGLLAHADRAMYVAKAAARESLR